MRIKKTTNRFAPFKRIVIKTIEIYDEDCPICYDGLTSENSVEGANCNHRLCEQCFLKIVNDTNKCPLCRRDFCQ